MPISVKENSKRISGNSFGPFVCPEQGYRRCFADVTNLGEITSTTQATLHVIPG